MSVSAIVKLLALWVGVAVCEPSCASGQAVGASALLQRRLVLGSQPAPDLALGEKLDALYADSLLGFAVADADVEYGECSDKDDDNDDWWDELMSKPELRQQWKALTQESSLPEEVKFNVLQEDSEEQGKQEEEVEEEEADAGRPQAMKTVSKKMIKTMTRAKMMKGMKKMMKAMKAGFLLQEDADQCCVPASYGEVSPLGVDQLAAVIGATKAAPVASFLDLGSGVGRLAMHMLLAGYARKVTGVELDTGRHRQTEILAKEVFPAGGAPRFLQANMLEVDQVGATVLYMNQQCFQSPEMRRDLAERILGGHFGDLQVLVVNPEMQEITASGLYAADEGHLELPMLHMESMEYRVYRKVQPDVERAGG